MLKYIYIIAIISVIITGCANQTAPTGGPKDETPPELLSSNPKDLATQVTAQEVTLTFNEYLKANKPQSEIIISPRPEGTFSLNIKKEKAILEFEKPLKDSTTYTISFRESIQDITEGNTPPNLKLAFSTGSYLDSLTISGTVTTLLDGAIADKSSLFLYDAKDTLIVTEDKPLYFTKTNEEGYYTFENLKPGLYLLYAVNDDNNNLKLDIRNEQYGFLTDTLALTSSLDNINLSLLAIDARQIELKSARQNGRVYEIKFNKFITDYELTSPDTTVALYSTFTEDQTGFQIYNTLTTDSLQLIYQVGDSVRQIYTDTTYIRFEPTERAGAKLNVTASLNKVNTESGLLTGEINSNIPIQTMLSDSLYVYLDSTHVYPLSQTNGLKANFNNTKFDLSLQLPTELFVKSSASTVTPKSKPVVNDTASVKQSAVKKTMGPHLYMGTGALISVTADSSASLKKDIQFKKSDQLGILHITVQTDVPHFIIQLLDKNFKVVEEVINETDITFRNLDAASYYLRAIHDENNNGKWDLGNLFKAVKPEPVYFYLNDSGQKEISIRANWEVGPLTLLF